MKDSDEFKVLKKVFKNLGNQYFDSSSLLVGPGDDAGLFKAKKELIFSTDTSVGDVHFPKDLEAKLIAYRACAVAASDIAACGGSLKWLSISLTTANKNTKWIENFSKGIKKFSDFYKVPVIGGDLAVGKEISVSVGVCGEIHKKDFMRRNGAREGDLIFVTGNLGEAFLGLNILKEKKKKLLSKEKNYLNRYLKPEIFFTFGQSLSKLANSCIDISDGLLGDLNHICEESKLAAEVYLEAMPIVGNYKNALTWGDDYQLCFTLKATKVEQLYKIAKTHKIKISEIGKIKKGKGISVLSKGKKITIKKAGYNHFNG
jgi:thiamine-monophosphate kinase